MPNGIQIRGPNQYRAQVRRNGIYQSRTFQTLREAQQWHRITDGKITGHEFVDNGRGLSTNLGKACDCCKACPSGQEYRFTARKDS